MSGKMCIETPPTVGISTSIGCEGRGETLLQVPSMTAALLVALSHGRLSASTPVWHGGKTPALASLSEKDGGEAPGMPFRNRIGALLWWVGEAKLGAIRLRLRCSPVCVPREQHSTDSTPQGKRLWMAREPGGAQREQSRRC